MILPSVRELYVDFSSLLIIFFLSNLFTDLLDKSPVWFQLYQFCLHLRNPSVLFQPGLDQDRLLLLHFLKLLLSCA